MKWTEKTYFFNQKFWEDETEHYSIYKSEDKKEYELRYLGASIIKGKHLEMVKDYASLYEMNGAFKNIKNLSRQESRQCFYDGIPKLKKYHSKLASVGYVQEPYHDITIYQDIETLEFCYSSYYIGD